MKKPYSVSFFILIIFCGSVFSQTTDTIYYHGNTYYESTGNSGTGANYDIIYHRTKWIINPDDASKTLTGSVTTYFKTIVANVNTISFDFNNNAFNNSDLIVKYHNNVISPFSFTNNILTINLSNPIATLGTIDSITIDYKGIPPAASGSAEGYQRKTDASGNNYIYTLSESYEDRDWWPCKADMQDKIDSVDINVITPDAFWVAANGVLMDSTSDGTNRNFVFKHRYPIASYLVAIGVAKYKRIYLGNVNSKGTQVPFVVNIFSGKTTTEENNILTRMNNNKLVFDTLCSLYGNYPFAKEKHGYYEFGFSGGMEHQTMSGMGTSSLTSNAVLAHELGHQWWGDKVTMATWQHLWLAEGFASLTEALAYEFVPAIGVSHITKMGNIKSSARSNTSTAILLSNITNSNTIWTNNNTTAVYDRGCMVASMLRVLLGDNKFFAACKSFLNDTTLAYKSAVTSDLQNHMQQYFGENLNGFFAEFITKKGTPNYVVEWGNVGNKINIKLTQSVNATGTTGTASTFMPMPVVIKIVDASNSVDTTVVIYHKSANTTAYAGDGIGATVNSNTISFNLSFTPANLTFDPLNKTMANASSITYSVALPIQNINIKAKSINNANSITVNITSIENIIKVELEKSYNGKDFAFAKTMNRISTTTNKFLFEAKDDQSKTKVYYRVKIFTNTDINYSTIIEVNNEEAQGFKITPNPAKDFITISFNNSFNKTIEIYSSTGVCIKTINTSNKIATVDTNELIDGCYFVQYIQNDCLYPSKKILITR